MRGVRQVLLLAMGMSLSAGMGRAQGCSACRDTTAGSAPRAREGLRRAIWVLGVPAGGICVGVFLIARRIEEGRES